MSTDVMENPADRIAAAAEAIKVVEDEPAVDPLDDAAAEPTETISEEVVPPVEAAPEPEESKTPAEKPSNGEWAALRRNQKKLEQQQAEFDQLIKTQQEQLKAKEDQLSPILDAVRSDPEEALRMIATAAGTDEDTLFRRVAERKINDGQPSIAEAMEEIKRLREEMAEADKTRTEKQKAKAKAEMEAREANAIEDYVREGMSLPSNPKAIEAFPNLTALPPAVLEGKLRFAINWAKDNSPDTPWPQLLKAVDELAGEEYVHQERARLARTSGSPSESQEAPRVPDKPAAPSRTISNQQQAQSSSKDKDYVLPSKQERLRRAAEALGIRK